MERSLKLKQYKIVYTENAMKSIKKIDRIHRIKIESWIEKNLINCENPYFTGKALKGDKKGKWRYRVGRYRIVASIDDDKILITIINIGHRQGIYNN